ncbi:DUF305 domain-containing protein [Kineosporiaceae bacterium SCSIO 59966]|nr:DUF305 domain-containing protein [Kineosporiaceae bacterium SCSIO 59966]
MRRTWRWAAVVLIVGVSTAAGMLAGSRLAAAPTSPPADDSVEAGFARDMSTHHAQAVQMSVLVRERTQDPEVATLALDILLTQQQQIGQMYAWLDRWNLPRASSRPAMAWMEDSPAMTSMDGSMPTGQSTMPGMASNEGLDRLRAAAGEEADRLFLQLMIPHHQAGVAMAEVAAAQAADDDVRRLAQTIVDSQSAEIGLLRDMLDAHGGPLPGR